MNDTRIELEALVTEREGMVTAVASALDVEPMPYTDEDFQKLAEKIRALSEPPKFVVPAGANLNGLDCKPGPIVFTPAVLQCPACGKPSVQGKRSGDICGRKLPLKDEPCPGVLR